MTPDRARWLLEHPLDRADVDLEPYRDLIAQPDGATLVRILAVDR